MANFKKTHATYMTIVAENRELAMAYASLASHAIDDFEGMECDSRYIEHMAHALYYLTHARKLRIKEKTNYGNQF